MKPLLLATFLLLTGIPIFAQHSEHIRQLNEFDAYMDRLVDELNYGKTHFSFCRLKKVAKRSRKKGDELNPHVNMAALETLLKEDPTINTLGLSQKALALLKEESYVQNFGHRQMGEKRRMFRALSNSKLYFADSVFEGMNLVGVFDASIHPDTFQSNIRNLTHFNTVHYLYECLKSWLELNELNKTSKNYRVLKDKMAVLEDHLLELTSNTYYKYDYTEISHKKIKDISVNTQNDLFVPGMNRDMGLTGGLQIDIGSDYMKMRLIPYINGDNILSYQSFNCGFYVFTPYLRDTDDSLKLLSYQYDRPFASTQYFGRTKYRLHRRGHIRHTGKFQLLVIGGQIAPYFQKLLHKDVAVSSVKPVGWNNQIANGGRLGFKVYHQFDFMLFSENASIFGTRTPFFRYLNPFLSADVQISHESSYVGAGLTFSSRDFFNASGNYQDFQLKKLQKIRLDYTLNFRYRYVIHNSMLEDFGVFERAEDDPFDDEYLSVYFLTPDQIRRNVFSASLQLNCRYRNATIFYSVVLHTKEFTERILPDNINPEYRTVLEDRFNYQWYGYGTLGLVFNIPNYKK